jgi:hypothetical protein
MHDKASATTPKFSCSEPELMAGCVRQTPRFRHLPAACVPIEWAYRSSLTRMDRCLTRHLVFCQASEEEHSKTRASKTLRNRRYYLACTVSDASLLGSAMQRLLTVTIVKQTHTTEDKDLNTILSAIWLSSHANRRRKKC